MAKLIYAAEAKLEIKEAAKYYEGCKEKLGHAFLKEVESAIRVFVKVLDDGARSAVNSGDAC